MLLGRRMAQDGATTAQEGAKMAQEGTKMAPRRAKDGSRGAQDGSKMGPGFVIAESKLLLSHDANAYCIYNMADYCTY